MPFMWVWLRLTIMKLASRKNMMSINGMISMRARFFGMGDVTFIDRSVRCPRQGERYRNLHFRNRARSESPAPESTDGRVVQDRIANALRHARVGHAAATRVDRHNANATPHDVPGTRFIRILGFR